jgi:hypothetical protein
MATIAGIRENVQVHLLGGTEEQRRQAAFVLDTMNYPVPPTAGDVVQLGTEFWVIAGRVVSDRGLCLTMRHIDRDTQPDRTQTEVTS